VRERATAGLSPEQLAQLMHLLQLVKENLIHAHEPIEVA
jgi:hypothetical protein